MTTKQAQELLRRTYLEIIKEALEARGEEVLRTDSNVLAVPCVDENGDEQFCCFTVKVPTGSRDGEAYDGYAMAQEYKMKTAEKLEQAKKAEAEKERKKARDAQMRAQKAAAKQAREKA